MGSCTGKTRGLCTAKLAASSRESRLRHARHNLQEKALKKDLRRISEETRQRTLRANSKRLRIEIVSPAPGFTVEVPELETVLTLLEKTALQLGLAKSNAPSLQLQFTSWTSLQLEKPLPLDMSLKAAGLDDGAQCSVLRVEVTKTAKAKQIDLPAAAMYHGRVAEVQLVCQYAPECVNSTDRVLRLLQPALASLNLLFEQYGKTALHWAAGAAHKDSLEIAELLLQAGATVNAKDKVRPGCSCVGAH